MHLAAPGSDARLGVSAAVDAMPPRGVKIPTVAQLGAECRNPRQATKTMQSQYVVRPVTPAPDRA